MMETEDGNPKMTKLERLKKLFHRSNIDTGFKEKQVKWRQNQGMYDEMEIETRRVKKNID